MLLLFSGILILLNAALSTHDDIKSDVIIEDDIKSDVIPHLDNVKLDVESSKSDYVKSDVTAQFVDDVFKKDVSIIEDKEGKAAIYIRSISQSAIFNRFCSLFPTVHVEHPSTFNAAEVLGAAFPWRCARRKRRSRNPSHFHLMKKALGAIERRLSEKVEPSWFRRMLFHAHSFMPWHWFCQKKGIYYQKKKHRSLVLIPTEKGKTLRQPRYSKSFAISRTRFTRRKWKEKSPKVKKDPHHWKHLSDAEILENYEMNQSKYLHLTTVQYEARFGINFSDFTNSIDPLHQYRLMKEFSDPMSLRCHSEESECDELRRKVSRATSEASALARAVDAARVQFGTLSETRKATILVAKAVGAAAIVDALGGSPISRVTPISGSHQSVYLSANSNTPMVIDTGASMSISPHRNDFKGGIRACTIKEINGINENVWNTIVQVGYEHDVDHIFGEGDTIPSLHDEWSSDPTSGIIAPGQQSSTLPGGNGKHVGVGNNVGVGNGVDGGTLQVPPVARFGKVSRVKSVNSVGKVSRVKSVKNSVKNININSIKNINSTQSANASVEDGNNKINQRRKQSASEGVEKSVPEGAEQSAPEGDGIAKEIHPSSKYGKEKQKLQALSQKIKHTALNQQFLASLKFADLVETLKTDEFSKMWSLTTDYDHDLSTCEWLHPMILAAKANSEDNPTWEEAMNGPLRDGYMKAAKSEIEILEKMEVWEVVPRLAQMNVLPGTWTFKCKRYPDGSVRKLKGRYCCRGDRQKDGVDFDSSEIYSPVVSWQTVRLLLILSIVLGLETKQVDYTAAFTHAPIGDKEVYCAMPRGFSKKGHVLKLKKSLYGLKQSPINFFNFIKGKLENAGLKSQETVDPCLFISDKVICLVYVDDTLFFSPKKEYIDDVITSLKDQQVAVEEEDSVAGFLGVHIDRSADNKTIKLTQKGLTKRIVEALQIDQKPKKYTPAKLDTLRKDPDGDPPNGSYSYASVIGMLLYLCGHSRPDIQFAVSQCARFIHGTKRSHEEALEHIGQYLKATMDEGLVLTPSNDFNIDCYVDADFAGLYHIDDVLDPSCVKSRTGYALCICDCPIVWVSKLQSDIATSTMEAEYNALSMAMRDLLPLRTVFGTIGNALGIGEDVTSSFKTTVHEDNQGCLRLAKKKPGQYTPRSKHYAVKYHWFRSHLSDSTNRTEVVHIDTKLQKADILTKSLPRQSFESIRKLLCGW